MNDEQLKQQAQQAITDTTLQTILLQNLQSKNDDLRTTSFKTLLFVSEQQPQVLYHYWEYFTTLLHSTNNYHKLIAIHLIANLIPVDTKHKFDVLFDDYFRIFNDNRTMTSGHLATVAGIIAKTQPQYQKQITKILLNINQYYTGNQLELIKAYIITAFNDYFDQTQDKEKIITFVRNQLHSTSPKTRKKAEEFLQKWDRH
jgi:hypothetical protein